MRQWAESIYLHTWVHGAAGVQSVTEVSSGRDIGTIGVAGASDVDHAVEIALPAQKQWTEKNSDERAAQLLLVKQNLADATEELTYWLVREAGATRTKAEREIRAAQAELSHAAELCRHNGRREVLTEARRQMVRRHPVGVAGIITPFNAPLVLAMRAIAPALALGNAVILKPDPRTAVAGGLAYPEIFEAAGLPAGLISVLPGGQDVGERLSEHPEIGSVLFTGSTPAGRAVGRAAGHALKRVGLELGGNNPVLILDDADIDQVAQRAVTSSFLHSGQICMSAGQYLVDKKVYTDFVDAFVQRASKLRVGDPWGDENVDMGPIIDDTSVDRLTRIVKESVAAGASLRLGGQASERYFPATILADVPEGAPAWREEAFGPIAPLRPVANVEEAVAAVERSSYGLVASVHTGDPERGRAVATRISTGTVRINDVTNHDDPRTPMVGRRTSGNSTPFGGEEMLELLTTLQLVSETR